MKNTQILFKKIKSLIKSRNKKNQLKINKKVNKSFQIYFINIFNKNFLKF